MTILTYPVHVDAQLDPHLNRGLWLLKWLLAVPHYVVLSLLWTAFVVTSVVAFFGILVTGRYPRAIFDFNVGVIRWTWRVAYYTYGALGTDRYPPFTLHDVPGYPAHLEVDYPEHLSRGLVLVKWWLLALPHYAVLALFLGGIGYAARSGATAQAGSPGLITILVLVAGVVLLFTGRYPARLFDLVLGLNRWVLRVACYVSLMTDRYPPFALDQGGHEDDGRGAALLTASVPGATASPENPSPTTSSPPTPSDPAPPTRPGEGWTGARATTLVAGCLLAVLGAGLAVAGTGLGAGALTARNDAGFLMTPTVAVASSGYAVTSTDLQLHSGSPDVPRAVVGDVAIRADAPSGSELFVGVARTADVDAYLGDATRSVLRDLTDGGARYEIRGTGTLAAPPAASDIWAAQASGPGSPSLTWPAESGDWTVVVMNADGTPGVVADVAAGAEVPALWWLVLGLFVAAALVLAAAVPLVVAPVRAAGRRTTSTP